MKCIPLGSKRTLELVDFRELSDAEATVAAESLQGVINDRFELDSSYPDIAKTYGSLKTGLERIKAMRAKANSSGGFIPAIIGETSSGELVEAHGVASAQLHSPQIRSYEKPSWFNKPDKRLLEVYKKLRTNVTFWCGRFVKIDVEGVGDNEFLLDPIAGDLVDSWGRRQGVLEADVYTLLPASLSMNDPIDPTEALREYGWVGTGITGISGYAGTNTKMEVIVPGEMNSFKF